MVNKYKWFSLMVVVLLTAISSVQAIPTLILWDSMGDTQTITSVSGVVQFTGSLGNWNINVTTGIASPPGPGGSLSYPVLDLNSVDVYTGSGAGNVLNISFTDDLLGPFTGSLNSSVGGTENGTAEFQGLINGQAGTDQAFSSVSFSGNANAGANATYPATLGILATITSSSGTWQTTSFDDQLTVPDGGSTIILLGTALSCIGLFFIRKPSNA